MIRQVLRSSIIRTSSHILVNRVFNIISRDQVAIFTLHRMQNSAHGINGHSPEFLRATLSYLRCEGYNLVSMGDVYRRLRGEGPPLHKAVAFTMDDGFIDQATIAAPIFAEFDCPVAIFLITGFLDRKLWPWDDRVSYMFSATKRRKLSVRVGGDDITYELSSVAQRAFAAKNFRNRLKLISEIEMRVALENLTRAADIEVPPEPMSPYMPMTWDMARRLESKGVTFAPHSVSHVILSRATSELAQFEIHESWRRLQEELSDPLPFFAYPTGRRIDFGIREFKILEDAGLFGAVTTEPGHANLTRGNNGRYARFQLNRYAYPDNMDDFIQYCSWLERAKMFLRMERVQLYAEEKYGGRRPILRHYASVAWDRFGGFWMYRQINWARVNRLVFVCKGNICRSPYAETRAKGYGIEVVSLGLTAKSGTLADSDAIKNAEVRGINLESHRAKRQEDVHIGSGDLLVAMEPWQASVLQRIAKKEGAQTTLLGLWGNSSHPYIHDPYGHGDTYFQTCFSVIDEAVGGLIKRTKSSENPTLARRRSF